MTKRHQQYEYNLFQIIVIGFFKALWWMIRLPFKGIKFSKGKAGLSLEDRNYIAMKRQKLELMLQSQNEIELKHALMEADKLVDYSLKAQGYVGETFADRLRNAEQGMNAQTYDEIWQGHKVRNQVAHEHELRISNQELSRASIKLLDYLKKI
jgi:hypothetical protein